MAGSFFQFSAGGWSQLKGYDLNPDAGAEKKQGLAALLAGGGGDDDVATGLFAVSCSKAARPPADANPLRRMAADLWEEHRLLPDEVSTHSTIDKERRGGVKMARERSREA